MHIQLAHGCSDPFHGCQGNLLCRMVKKVTGNSPLRLSSQVPVSLLTSHFTRYVVLCTTIVVSDIHCTTQTCITAWQNNSLRVVSCQSARVCQYWHLYLQQYVNVIVEQGWWHPHYDYIIIISGWPLGRRESTHLTTTISYPTILSAATNGRTDTIKDD